jgi:hypothetical protein
MNIIALPKSLYYFKKTSGPTTQSGIVFLQICQVGELAIIHKWNEPNLARGQTVK